MARRLCCRCRCHRALFRAEFFSALQLYRILEDLAAVYVRRLRQIVGCRFSSIRGHFPERGCAPSLLSVDAAPTREDTRPAAADGPLHCATPKSAASEAIPLATCQQLRKKGFLPRGHRDSWDNHRKPGCDTSRRAPPDRFARIR